MNNTEFRLVHLCKISDLPVNQDVKKENIDTNISNIVFNKTKSNDFTLSFNSDNQHFIVKHNQGELKVEDDNGNAIENSMPAIINCFRILYSLDSTLSPDMNARKIQNFGKKN